MTENSPVIVSRWGANNLRNAPAADVGAFGLKNAVSRADLSLVEVYIWRISVLGPHSIFSSSVMRITAGAHRHGL